MKRYYKFAIPALLILLTLSYSCKKMLDQQPVGSLSSAVLANKAGVDGLLIGAYAMLKGWGNNAGTSWESGIDNWLYGGVAADDAYKGSNATDQDDAAPVANHSLDPSNNYIAQKWAAFFNAVQRANDVIREIPLVKDGSVSAAYGHEVIGEARFLRGVFNLELSKMFRNVPYVDETIDYAHGNYNAPNNGPIFAQIENDFKAAMAVLPKTQPQAGRANYYAAEALLAKTYMTEGKAQYATALPLLTDLIDNGETSGGQKYALGPYEDNFNAIKKNGPESVFAVQMTVNDGSGGANGNPGEVLNFPAGPYTGCCGFDQPSYTLANAFKTDANGLPLLGNTTVTVQDFTPNNATVSVTATLPNYNLANLPNDHGLSAADSFTPPTANLDPRIDWTLGRRGIPYLDWGLCGGEQWSRGDLCPYNPIKNVFYHSQQASTTDNFGGWAANQDVANNYNIIRFADVILWRAECEIEANNLAGAEADVNMVRNRMAQHPEYWVHTYVDNANPASGFTGTPAANYVIKPYSGQFAANGQAYAREAVHMEEQLEFGMEGHRFFDLQRWDAQFGGPETTAGATAFGSTTYMAGVENAHIAADTRTYNAILNSHTFIGGKNELYPIPLEQIDLENGALKQNPKY